MERPYSPILIVVILALLAVYVLIAGTREHRDALASLDDPKLSSEFDSGYWLRQSKDETTVWGEARAACEHGESNAARPRPNCRVVALVAEERRVAGFVVTPPRAGQVASAEIGNGLTGHGARPGSIPSVRP